MEMNTCMCSKTSGQQPEPCSSAVVSAVHACVTAGLGQGERPAAQAAAHEMPTSPASKAKGSVLNDLQTKREALLDGQAGWLRKVHVEGLQLTFLLRHARVHDHEHAIKILHETYVTSQPLVLKGAEGSTALPAACMSMHMPHDMYVPCPGRPNTSGSSGCLSSPTIEP
eukprot:366412-Chlamydomonas_euryale.AAC.13